MDKKADIITTAILLGLLCGSILVGCATPNIGATKEAALTPLNNIAVEADSITTSAGTIRQDVNKSTDPAIAPKIEPQLESIETNAKSIKTEASTATVAISKQAIIAQETTDKYVAEKKLYDTSWFAGKTWVAIYWICGIGATLLVADAVAYFFFGVSIMNPLVLIGKVIKMGFQFIGYIMSLFRKPGSGVLGSGTIK